MRDRVRAIARRMPVTGAYERRISELTAEVHRLTEQVHQVVGQLEDIAANGPWVPPGHFYSPLPDLAEIEADRERIFPMSPAEAIELAGVDLHLEAQWALLEQLAPLADDLDLALERETAADRGHRYWADNPGYPPGDARSLAMMLRHLRPTRLVELGSGFSSAVTLDVRDRFLDGQLDITFVDPYPDQLEALLRDSDRDTVRVIARRTQDLDLEVFEALGAGDVLFVDSTHVARTGSDVNRIVFEILPALAPGVLVHFHDVFPGFEYPEAWVMEGRGWSEQYVLRAFLQYSDRYRVEFWPTLLHTVADESQRERFGVLPLLQGGAIWLRSR